MKKKFRRTSRFRKTIERDLCAGKKTSAIPRMVVTSTLTPAYISVVCLSGPSIGLLECKLQQCSEHVKKWNELQNHGSESNFLKSLLHPAPTKFIMMSAMETKA